MPKNAQYVMRGKRTLQATSKAGHGHENVDNVLRFDAAQHAIKEKCRVVSIAKATHNSKKDGEGADFESATYNIMHPDFTKWATSMSGFCLVNRQLYEECSKYLYSAVVFFLQAPRQLYGFSQLVDESRLLWIKKLHIDHETANHARLHADEQWRARQIESWQQIYSQVGRLMPNLEELHINIRIYERPTVLSFHKYLFWTTSWVDNLCALAGQKNLKDVQVRLSSKLLDNVYMDATNPQPGPGQPSLSPLQLRRRVDFSQGIRQVHGYFEEAIVKVIKGVCQNCAEEWFCRMVDRVRDPMEPVLRNEMDMALLLFRHWQGTHFQPILPFEGCRCDPSTTSSNIAKD
jgi:hypothetical protein